MDGSTIEVHTLFFLCALHLYITTKEKMLKDFINSKSIFWMPDLANKDTDLPSLISIAIFIHDIYILVKSRLYCNYF